VSGLAGVSYAAQAKPAGVESKSDLRLYGVVTRFVVMVHAMGVAVFLLPRHFTLR
jgi:hypothetical protein